jgi:hypothetical protein
VEAEACLGSDRVRTIAACDVDAIAPMRPSDRGYYAFLDASPIAEWIAVEHNRVRRRVGETFSLAVLHVMRDADFSNRLSLGFAAQVLACGPSLLLYPLSRLREMALRGEMLALSDSEA